MTNTNGMSWVQVTSDDLTDREIAPELIGKRCKFLGSDGAIRAEGVIVSIEPADQRIFIETTTCGGSKSRESMQIGVANWSARVLLMAPKERPIEVGDTIEITRKVETRDPEVGTQHVVKRLSGVFIIINWQNQPDNWPLTHTQVKRVSSPAQVREAVQETISVGDTIQLTRKIIGGDPEPGSQHLVKKKRAIVIFTSNGRATKDSP